MMITRRIIPSACIFVGMQMLAVPLAFADFIPTHGAVVHQNPFDAGWPVVGLPPAPGVGVVINPFGTYDILGPQPTADFIGGFDGLASPTEPWHWEVELDLDLYAAWAPGANPLPAVVFGVPVAIPLGPGPDIYFDIHIPDVPEVGPFATGLINLTPWVLAWGTSVTEDPGPPGPAPGMIEKFVEFPFDRSLDFYLTEPAFDLSAFQLDFVGGEFSVTQIPAPGAVLLGAMGLGLVGWVKRRFS